MLAVGTGVVGVLVVETVTDFVAERDPPTQVSEKVLVAVTAKLCWPFVGLAPDHAPEPVHEVARDDDQLRTVELPWGTLVGDAEKDRDMGAAKTAVGARNANAPNASVRKKRLMNYLNRSEIEFVLIGYGFPQLYCAGNSPRTKGRCCRSCSWSPALRSLTGRRQRGGEGSFEGLETSGCYKFPMCAVSWAQTHVGLFR